ncbi:MAG: DegV family protein [Clostridia bacterium]|nr:DegV family protein [Clostridia bacterium]
MSNYVIHTDSGCDIRPELLAEWEVPFTCLTFRFDDSEKEYTNIEMGAAEFYAKMRAGGVAKTAAVNTESFRADFEATLKQGKDVLYLGFSSGLSTTFNSARIASLALAEEYPDRKIVVIDTLAASAGEGLLVYYAVQKMEEGASIEENAEYVKSLIPKLAHWFTVDDLVYLKRGGRVSPTAAFFGNMLGIKPVMHVDDEGHLIPMEKVRGRKTAVATLAAKYGQFAENPGKDVVFVSHGDCMKDVEELGAILKEKYGAEFKVITDVGPVIGAHSGPGTLALFYVGKER